MNPFFYPLAALLFPRPKMLWKSTFPLTILHHLIEIYFLKEVLFQKEIGKDGKGNMKWRKERTQKRKKMVKKTKCIRQN